MSKIEKVGGVRFSESVLFREKTRKIARKNLKKKGIEKSQKGREDVGKGSIPLLIKIEDENSSFYSKMGKEYSNSKRRRKEDLKVI